VVRFSVGAIGAEKRADAPAVGPGDRAADRRRSSGSGGRRTSSNRDLMERGGGGLKFGGHRRGTHAGHFTRPRAGATARGERHGPVGLKQDHRRAAMP